MLQYREEKVVYDTSMSFEEYKDRTAARVNAGRFLKSRAKTVRPQFSNGETAMDYYQKEITPNGIYLLDEPENCLAPKFQLELMEFILTSARFFDCQFIISTHSPFILSLDGAKVYNLDCHPAKVEEWFELESVKAYYQLFKNNAEKFK